jgi:hypothetical protein
MAQALFELAEASRRGERRVTVAEIISRWQPLKRPSRGPHE